jgi:hypothetical protein
VRKRLSESETTNCILVAIPDGKCDYGPDSKARNAMELA